MKILNFGSCNIDITYLVDHIVIPGETLSSYGLEYSCGGKGLNQSIAVTKAGEKVYHAGCIGNDGQKLRDMLIKNGVDVSRLKSIDAPSGHAIIQVNKNGENSILLHSGTNDMVTKEFIDDVLGDFSAGDILMLQNEISNVNYIITKAHSLGMKIVLNPAPFGENIKSIDLNMLCYLILNEVEGKGLTEKECPEEMIEYLRSEYPGLGIVLTLGGKGCIYTDNSRVLRQPAFDVEAVDTTSAGDTFIGYFIAEIANGSSCERAVEIACAASAITVSRKGSSASIPSRNEVTSALDRLELRKTNQAEYLLEQIDYYLDENIKTAKLSELAERLNYSQNYIGERIKRITDKTFSQLLQEKRCNIAAKLLVETDLPIERIINLTGYQNNSFFRMKFREIYKTTPYRYRKTGKEGYENGR